MNIAWLLRWRKTEMDAAVKGKAHRTKSGDCGARVRLHHNAERRVSVSMWDVLSFEM